MDEPEWLASGAPDKMIQYLDRCYTGTVGERKLRLFACACCRRIWDRLPDAEHRRAVEVAERFADGLAGPTELAEARQAVSQAIRRSAVLGRSDTASWAVLHTAGEVRSWNTWVSIAADAIGSPRARDAERQEQAVLLRDILGNPFRPATDDRAWLNWTAGAVVPVAQAIYDEQRFGDLPILADALEEAGCTDPEILAHCRGPGPHARGCWVVDGILGKT
jgi:hypothetical protein